MVEITLYNQPMEEKPFLDQKALQNGVIEYTKKGVFSNYMMFTDVGKAAWEAAKKIDRNAKIKQHKIPFFKRESAQAQELQWDVAISVKGFELMMHSRSYRSGKKPSAYYIRFKFSGDERKIVRFVDKYISTLGREPYSFTNISKLATELGLQRSLLTKSWKDIKLSKKAMEITRKVDSRMRELRSFCKDRKTNVTLERKVKRKLEPAIEHGDLNKARIIAKKIQKEIDKIKKDHQSLKKELKKTKRLIGMAKKLGREIKHPHTYYKKAVNAYNKSNYDLARKYAKRSAKLATLKPKGPETKAEKAEPEPEPTPEPEPEPVVEEPSTAATTKEDEPKEELIGEPLNPQYTFDTYVIGPSNQFVSAAAKAVAKKPATVYNPLFIHSSVGLGKTHLLNAIGNELLRNNPNYKIVYVTSERFTNDLLTAINKGEIEQFRARYRSSDILMVEDIQFLEGKEATQEEFFHTFNALYNANKQICVTSDRPATKLHNLADRIVSRFEGGLIADVQPPTTEMKLIILQNQAREEKLDVPSDVLYLLAQNIKSNVRKLKGALTKIGAYASITNKPITIDMAREVLKSVVPDLDTAPNTPAGAAVGSEPVFVLDEGVKERAEVALKEDEEEELEFVIEEEPESSLLDETELIGGVSYLIEEERPNCAFKFFEKQYEKMCRGLIITRSNPTLIKKKYDVLGAKVLWLTNRAKSANTIEPRLETMIYTIEDFYEDLSEGVILFDGVEYLVSMHGFDSVLKFVRECIDGISLSQTALIIPLNPAALPSQQASMLKREMETIMC